MQDIDHFGISTLESISEAPHFNEWMFQTIQPHLKGKVLELGTGIGNIAQFAIKEGLDITLSDLRENYQQFLKAKFHFDDSKVLSIDMVHPQFDEVYGYLFNQFDSLYALNVVEHIEDHTLAMRNASKLLKAKGVLIVLVPAYQSLYNEFDKELGHYRRFTKKSLRAFVPKDIFQEKNIQYFNLVGIAGWFVSGNIFKQKNIGKGSMKTFDFLLPAIKLIDLLSFRKAGLSVWTTLEKKELSHQHYRTSSFKPIRG